MDAFASIYKNNSRQTQISITGLLLHTTRRIHRNTQILVKPPRGLGVRLCFFVCHNVLRSPADQTG